MTTIRADRRRAEDRFRSAAISLQNALPQSICARLSETDFPEFENAGVEESAAKLEAAIESLIESRKEFETKGNGMKYKDLATKWFRALYPVRYAFPHSCTRRLSSKRAVLVANAIDTCSKPLWDSVCHSHCIDKGVIAESISEYEKLLLITAL
jgi:hypothetical protein